MASYDNQKLYLENLVKQGGGNGEWAKQQLKLPNLGLPTSNVPAPNGASSSGYSSNTGYSAPATYSSPGTSSSSSNYSTPATYSAPATYSSDPRYGYGAATGQAATDNDTRLRNDPAFLASEYTRANDVINNRRSAGMETSAQDAYLAKLMSMGAGANSGNGQSQSAGSTDSASSSTTYVPNANANAYVPNPYAVSPEQITRNAAADIANRRAAITGAVDAYNRSLKNSYGQEQRMTSDQRALEDVRLSQTMAPTTFSGGAAYQRAMIDRTRGLQDMALSQDYLGKLAESNQKLLDFEMLAPEEQEKLISEMKQKERELGLAEGELTGYYLGNRTLEGQAQDAEYTGYYLGNRTLDGQAQDANYTGYYQGLRTLDGLKLDQDKQLQIAELTGMMPDGTKTSAQQQIDLEALWVLSENTGVIHPTLAKMYGIPEGTKTQAALQFAADLAFKNKQADRDYQISLGNLAVNRQNANTNASEANWRRDPNNPANQVPAPSGGSSGDGPVTDPSNSKYNYKKDPFFTEAYQDIMDGKIYGYVRQRDKDLGLKEHARVVAKEPKEVYEYLVKNATAYINDFTYDGYMALLNAAKDKKQGN